MNEWILLFVILIVSTALSCFVMCLGFLAMYDRDVFRSLFVSVFQMIKYFAPRS